MEKVILHKYLNFEHGKDVLLKQKLKASLPTKLNDPFEFLPQSTGVWTLRKTKKFLKDKDRQNRMFEDQKKRGVVITKKKFKEQLKNLDYAKDLLERFNKHVRWEDILMLKNNADKYIRFISFSSDRAKWTDEILMWSHYSNNHTGIRIHFDSEIIKKNPKFDLKEINYSKTRPEVDLTLENNNYKFMNQIITTMSTKATCWEYEKEYRLFVDPTICKKDNTNDFWFVKIPLESIKRVDVGFMNDKNINSINELSKQNTFSSIRFFKSQLNEKEYKLDYIPL